MPDDPKITDMDPVQKIWAYENWAADQNDDIELAKNHAYLLGSFWNPEAVQEMTNANVHESSEEDFEESLNIITDFNKEMEDKAPKRRRQKAKLIQQNPQG